MPQASSPRSLTRTTILGYVSLCVIWGSTWLGIRILVRDVPPLEGAGLRFLMAAAVLAFPAVLGKRPWPRMRREWIALLVLSFSMIAIPYALIFWAEQYVTSSMTAVLFSSSPLMVALFTPLMTHRRVPRSAIFALTVAFGGLLILLYTGLSTHQSLWGWAAVLLSVVLSACSIVFAKERIHDVDPVIATGVQLFVGSLALLAGSWIFESGQTAHWSPSALIALGFLVLFGSCLAFVIYYALLKNMQPYQLATLNLVVPIIAVLEGSLLIREPVPPLMLVAMVVVLVAVGSVLRTEAVSENPDDILMLREGRP